MVVTDDEVLFVISYFNAASIVNAVVIVIAVVVVVRLFFWRYRCDNRDFGFAELLADALIVTALDRSVVVDVFNDGGDVNKTIEGCRCSTSGATERNKVGTTVRTILHDGQLWHEAGDTGVP